MLYLDISVKTKLEFDHTVSNCPLKMTIINLITTLCACYLFAMIGFDKSFGQKMHGKDSSFTRYKGK